MMMQMHYSRRTVLKAMGTVAALCSFGLHGCGDGDSDPHSRVGLASDCEVKDYPVTLKLLADYDIQWHHGWEGYDNHLAYYIGLYKEFEGREDVDINVDYVGAYELRNMARDGFPEADGILALDHIVSLGSETGTVDSGAGGYMVRRMWYNFRDDCVLVRAVGSKADLPPAKTIDGEDTADGTVNRFQQIPEFDGMIAIADPSAEAVGYCALNILANEGFYEGSNLGGGTWDDRVVDKLRMYPDQETAMEALVAGKCQIGFALRSSVGTRFPEIEECRQNGHGMVTFSAAALSGAEEPGVMRDFFEFILRHQD